jgi:rhamnose utilization protein RhaD (predicted bifunctional aldolase and dehydrogenase)
VKNAAQLRLWSARNESELARLRGMSARVGSDPLLVQASNGNTSIKLDGILWVKASGRCLARAMQDEIFVPLDLLTVRELIQNGTEISWPNALNHEFYPSIETAMHAILEHRVVIHVHSINAIAWAIRLDGPDQLKARLAGLRWRWIPYAASGIPLAREIEKAIAGEAAIDVLILANHGLVVCGHDCEAAETLLRCVEQRLAIPTRRFPGPGVRELAAMARISNWEVPDLELLHALGTEDASQTILTGGVLYPCQAIFLGPTVTFLSLANAASKFSEFLNCGGRTPPFVVVERIGVVLCENMTRAERATLIGLAEVTLRTDRYSRLRYLTEAELAEVLGEGGHAYKERVSDEIRNPWVESNFAIPHTLVQT